MFIKQPRKHSQLTFQLKRSMVSPLKSSCRDLLVFSCIHLSTSSSLVAGSGCMSILNSSIQTHLIHPHYSYKSLKPLLQREIQHRILVLKQIRSNSTAVLLSSIHPCSVGGIEKIWNRPKLCLHDIRHTHGEKHGTQQKEQFITLHSYLYVVYYYFLPLLLMTNQKKTKAEGIRGKAQWIYMNTDISSITKVPNCCPWRLYTSVNNPTVKITHIISL